MTVFKRRKPDRIKTVAVIDKSLDLKKMICQMQIIFFY